MRDPAARVRMEHDRVVRELRAPLPAEHFLRSSLAVEWRERGDLVDFEIIDDHTVTARRVPFVSLPVEWCDAQLHQAAALTLRLQREAVAAGFDLKDASAWNVIFEGGRPVFCDLLSLDSLARRPWWAAGQFARHFVLPLLLAGRRALPAHKAFLAWRDGVPHEVARRMLGPSRFLTRYWPLMAGAASGSAATLQPASPASDIDAIRRFRAGLDSSLQWMLAGVDPLRRLPQASVWMNYVSERGHYSNDDLEAKRGQISGWLAEQAPARVLDLGCNSGEFSRLAAAAGAAVIAVDLDHGAITRGVAQATEGIDFLVATLDDLHGGFGWAAREQAGLPARLHKQSDLILMLALIHHLVLGASIPLAEVARFAADCTRRWLVLELIAPADVQIGVLQAQRDRADPFPSMDEQLQQFGRAGFVLRQRLVLPTGTRDLVLLELVGP